MVFVKGQSGNPKGRERKGTSLSDLLRAHLETRDETGVQLRQVMIAKLAEKACKGDLDAMKIALERIDGKVADIHTFQGKVRIALSWDDGDSDD